jgi:hypothetical protein
VLFNLKSAPTYQCAKEKKTGDKERKKEEKKETYLSSSVSAAWIPFVATLPPLGQQLNRVGCVASCDR